MLDLIIRLLVGGLSVIIASYIIPGVHVDTFLTAVIVAVVMGFVNAVIRPVFIILTLPLTIITLGLFTVVINAILVLLVSAFIPGFTVSGFVAALFFSLFLSITQSILHALTRS